MDQGLFVKSITTDDKGRVIVAVQEQFTAYLQDESSKKMLKSIAKEALGDDFLQLEVSPSTFRITVAEGQTEHAKQIIQSEINKQLEMALSFLSQLGQ